MFEALDMTSGASRQLLLDSRMMTAAAEIDACYGKLRAFHDALSGGMAFDPLRHTLSGLKDIRGTISRIQGGLDDVGLFEIKELCLLTISAARALDSAGIEAVELPELHDPLDILDPEKQRIASFYVYDSYSEELQQMRSRLKKEREDSEELLQEIFSLEDRIRHQLSSRLREYSGILLEALHGLAEVDILISKAMQIRAMGLCFPQISADGQTVYEDMFHPQVREEVESRGGRFQPVSIGFGKEPVTIIGANMGGKTVVLRMLTLNQQLFQFGFGIAARSAVIDIKEGVSLFLAEEASREGLSSFAAEVVRINGVIASARNGEHTLALIDEPARTTNPVEGSALVAALIDVLSGTAANLVLTTHYDLKNAAGRRLKVRGMSQGHMDYRLEEVAGGKVPLEALNVARQLGADEQWVERASELLDKERNEICKVK